MNGFYEWPAAAACSLGRQSAAKVGDLFGISKFEQDVVADVDSRRSVDDGRGRGSVDDELEVACLGYGLDGVIYLVVYGCDEALSFFKELAFRAEVFLFEVCGFLLFVDDGLFFFLLLGFAEEDALVLVVLVEGGGFVADGLYFVLPGS